MQKTRLFYEQYNDTLGHKAGDQYIREACMIICNHFKHSPVYRVGGDEFVILLQGSDYEDRAELMRTINEKIEGNVGTPNAVIALGCAEYQPDDRSFHAVFERADGAMYRGKKELKSMGAVIRDL